MRGLYHGTHQWIDSVYGRGGRVGGSVPDHVVRFTQPPYNHHGKRNKYIPGAQALPGNRWGAAERLAVLGAISK